MSPRSPPRNRTGRASARSPAPQPRPASKASVQLPVPFPAVAAQAGTHTENSYNVNTRKSLRSRDEAAIEPPSEEVTSPPLSPSATAAATPSASHPVPRASSQINGQWRSSRGGRFVPHRVSGELISAAPHRAAQAKWGDFPQGGLVSPSLSISSSRLPPNSLARSRFLKQGDKIKQDRNTVAPYIFSIKE